MFRLYRKPALGASGLKRVLSMLRRLGLDTEDVSSEWCYHIETSLPLEVAESERIQWLLRETFEPQGLSDRSFVADAKTILEVGPRPNFETAWSTTAVAICHACGLETIQRMERSLRIGLSVELRADQREALLASLHDRMTEMPYTEPLTSFGTGIKPEPTRIIKICGVRNWREVLKRYSDAHGYGWDDQDIDMIGHLFREVLHRDPTDVELFQLAQANSEHSRHFLFKGSVIVDGKQKPFSLMDIIQQPWEANPNNSIIAFCDDSSAIRGFETLAMTADYPSGPGQIRPVPLLRHPTLTGETHNFPSGVAPYPGAATGTGGRIRDNFAVGRGGNVIAAAAAYCVDNLHIPGYPMVWENDGWHHPDNLASPLDILIQASNGASDYGNCFGEPVVLGFTRSYGLEPTTKCERRGWYKPIMYTAGVGDIPETSRGPQRPDKGMLVLQLGGPAFRVGVSGGSASSMIQGANQEELDFNAVQRGDPQMEQRLNRLIRGCIELGPNNPIERMVDLGAGGSCNAIPELVNPAGARINLRALPSGDATLSPRELWGNESQERAAILVRPEHLGVVEKIAKRENVPCAVVGEITDDGRLVVFDESDEVETPVDLPMEQILGSLPPKTFEFTSRPSDHTPLKIPRDMSVAEALDRVLRLVSVGSKRFLTTKVDRSVTGLIAQQQCVGPNQLTLSDYSVVAHSYFEHSGTAWAIGEQPIKGLLSPGAGARMAVTEMLFNLAGARITDIEDIRCSANWMLAAKLDGEGAWLYKAACALRHICIELGIAIDGGKDSLSMAAQVAGPDGVKQIVKAPAELVIAGYATMKDITRKVTPDIKRRGTSIVYVRPSPSFYRLGGTALAQVFGQLGDECPDCNDIQMVKAAFNTVQQLLDEDCILSLHDISDGGLITALLEMAFAGNVGLEIDTMEPTCTPIEMLFTEEPGLVIETDKPEKVLYAFGYDGVFARIIGSVANHNEIQIRHNGEEVLSAEMVDLRRTWESTSSAIDALQANPDCVAEETEANYRLLTPPLRHLTFVPQARDLPDKRPTVAILRNEGSNGDREMAGAFYHAGFETHDVTMRDLLAGDVSLDDFRGVAFVGGFSYADVLDAGKGWAGTIRFNQQLREQFDRFRDRPNTFSLGVCNGCQLMALMGWVPGLNLPEERQPRFVRNQSERFESRFSTVQIFGSPSIMLDGMAGSTMGIWVAHGEGRVTIPCEDDKRRIIASNLAPIRFVDPDGQLATRYPHNPNGSPLGITALCSPDGRHLAMMPHPERSFLKWQLPWAPAEWDDYEVSPWLRLFQNAYKWCTG